MTFFDANFLSSLERLGLIAKKILSQAKFGKRPGNRKGGTTEFADYRHYSSGDEIKYLDWNIYARHNELFIKEFMSDERVHITIFIDNSKSMCIGIPSKLESAKKLAAALCYIGLVNFDSVSIYKFSDKIEPIKTFAEGKTRFIEILKSLDALTCQGTTDLKYAFSAQTANLRGKNIMIIITDMWDKKSYKTAFDNLTRAEINLIHMISDLELNPKMRGNTLLEDIERKQRRTLFITDEVINSYTERFNLFQTEIAEFCKKREMSYIQLLSTQNVEDMVSHILKSGSFIEES